MMTSCVQSSALAPLGFEMQATHIKVFYPGDVGVAIVVGGGATGRDTTKHVHTLQHQVQDLTTHVV